MPKLLITDDDLHLRKLVRTYAEVDGYACEEAENGFQALEKLQCRQFDLMILDIMMPGRDGLSILRGLRAAGRTLPVLLLTALDAVGDRVSGLDAGADDYLTKPFAFDELLARIRVLLRRSSSDKAVVLTAEDLTMELSTRTVRRAGQEITLSSKEYAILEYLLRNKGVVLSRAQLESHVWDYDFEGGSNIVDVYVRYLRRKIDDPFEKKLIQTVRGVGYTIRQTP